MSQIGPISSTSRVSLPQNLEIRAPETKTNDGANFGDVLKACVNQVDAKQRASSSAIQDLVSGKTNDVLPVVSAVAKADLSFKLLMGVRNKVVDAYKETMRMQI